MLGAEQGGRFVRALFPRYYAWCVVTGMVAFVALLGVAFGVPGTRGFLTGLQAELIAAGTFTMMYCGQTLTTQINAARDQGPAGAERFDRLHRRSVWLNGLTLVVGIVLLVLFATRPRPIVPEMGKDVNRVVRSESESGASR